MHNKAMKITEEVCHSLYRSHRTRFSTRNVTCSVENWIQVFCRCVSTNKCPTLLTFKPKIKNNDNWFSSDCRQKCNTVDQSVKDQLRISGSDHMLTCLTGDHLSGNNVWSANWMKLNPKINEKFTVIDQYGIHSQ